MTTTKAKLTSWNQLTQDLTLPQDVAAAVMTGRPQLLRPRPLAKEECAQIYKLVEVLIETNQELQHHSRQVARRAESVEGALRGLHTQFDALKKLADFEEEIDGEEGR